LQPAAQFRDGGLTQEMKVLCEVLDYVKLGIPSPQFPLILAVSMPSTAEFTAHNFML
jgi:hypothetical protein